MRDWSASVVSAFAADPLRQATTYGCTKIFSTTPDRVEQASTLASVCPAWSVTAYYTGMSAANADTMRKESVLHELCTFPFEYVLLYLGQASDLAVDR